MSAFDYIAILVVFGSILYYWTISTFNFWKERGIPGPKPIPLLGNFQDVIFGKKSLGEWVSSFYLNYVDEPLIGVFINRRPVLIVKDLDLVRDVLIKDFSKFPDRGIKTFPKAEPLWQNLLTLEHSIWRPMRNCLSPAFTSGKLKDMFYLLSNCGDNLQNYLDKLIVKNEPIEVRDLTARFTTDVIGTCAFGLEVHAMDENSEFRKMGKYAVNFDWKKVLKLRIKEAAPWLYSLLWPIMIDKPLTDFMMSTMKTTIDYRRKNNVVRHDFIDQIIEIQDNPGKIPGVELTDSLLASQLFVFFLAGFETSSTTISNALYELAQHQDYQERLRDEIRKVRKSKGELTYEIVKNMEYLNMVFQETLRKYPPAMILFRRSDVAYTFSYTKMKNYQSVTIPKDTQIIIPMLGIHNDPEIYPDPSKFNPERFKKDTFTSRHPMAYLAFGDGSRNCIGERFAKQQTKVGLIKILEKFRVEVSEKTEIPYKRNPRGFLLSPLNGIYLKFQKI